MSDIRSTITPVVLSALLFGAAAAWTSPSRSTPAASKPGLTKYHNARLGQDKLPYPR
jgi:hypothetical protein